METLDIYYYVLVLVSVVLLAIGLEMYIKYLDEDDK